MLRSDPGLPINAERYDRATTCVMTLKAEPPHHNGLGHYYGDGVVETIVRVLHYTRQQQRVRRRHPRSSC